MTPTAPIQLHDSMQRGKRPFVPGDPQRVTMYVCGPTVYNFAHIGNARPAVVFDVLARLLRHHYPKVVYARNFTDVDDKINAAAMQQHVPIGVITDRYIAAYHEDMQALGVLAPDLEPRVTQHMPDIIALIEKLIARGHAYEAQSHVLFHVPSFADYGKLSGRSPQDMIAGARVEVAPYKRDPMDFVLWKPSTPEQPGWDSPWGRGRPGWHVECSAMIERELGETIDLHGGGQDLIFPHHENEIAQGTCAHDGQQYCRHWVHNSFITVEGQKMSKSLGNVLLVRDLLAQAPGEAIRLALLSTHYRHPLDWNTQRLAAARKTLHNLYETLERVADVPVPADAAPDAEVLAALGNDLNTPAALARLHQLAGALNKAQEAAQQSRLKGQLLQSAGLMGLLGQTPAVALQALRQPQQAAQDALDAEWIEAMLARRQAARQQRDFAAADALRDELLQAGVQIKDTPDGQTTWQAAELPEPA